VVLTGKRRLVSVLLGVALLALACSESPTSDEDGDKKQPKDASARLEEIYAELEGLDLKGRREALIKMAEDEGGQLNLYGSTNLDEADPIISAFEDETDLEPNLYRASSTDLAQRILQEADAGFAGADLVYTNGPEMAILDNEGLLLPLESPAEENLVQEAIVSENWLPIYLNLFTAAWNTKEVGSGEEPTTWEEVFTKFQGKLAMEVGDYDWFMTLVTQYFVEQQGMSEEEAVELFKDAARGASMIDGHTLMTELLAAGEFDAATSVYKHRVEQLQKDGAPVEWEPAVQPLVLRPNGIGILKTTEHPATSLLFAEFMLTDVQSMLLDFDRTPADVNAPGGGIPADIEVLITDLEKLFQENDKWEGLYEEVAAESGGEVIED
jgi:iron(III) transport system substrate-binding protein